MILRSHITGLLLFLVNGPRVDSATPRESVNGVEGKSLTLSCPVPARVDVVSWKKDTLLGESVITYGFTAGKARSLSYGKRWPRGQVTVSGFDITITQVNKSRDAGVILCGKTVGLGQGTWKIYDVTVNVPPTILSVTKDGKTVGDGDLTLIEDVGTPFRVSVNPETDKPYTVKWKVGNSILKDSTEVTYTVKAKREWHGKKLECVAKNKYGESKKEWMLVIYYGPIIKLSPNQETFIVREHSKLEITASGDARPLVNEIKWTINRKDIISDSGLLKFRSITRDRAGNYTVLVANSEKEVRKDITIIVQYPPSANITKVGEGQLRCTAKHGVPRGVTFSMVIQRVYGEYVRGLPIVGSSESLTVNVNYNASSYEDNGDYFCTVNNSIGSNNASVAITTNSPPVVLSYPKQFFIGINETKEIIVKFYSVRKLKTSEWSHKSEGGDVAVSRDVSLRDSQRMSSLKFHKKSIMVPTMESVLMIRRAAMDDRGVYTLVVNNGYNTTVRVNVTVTMEPTITTLTPAVPDDSSSGISPGMVGGVIAAVLIVGLIIVLLLFLLLKRRRAKDAGGMEILDNKANEQSMVSPGSSDNIAMMPNDLYESSDVKPREPDSGHVNGARTDDHEDIEEHIYSKAMKSETQPPKKSVYPLLYSDPSQMPSAPTQETDEMTYSTPNLGRRNDESVYENTPVVTVKADDKKTDLTYSQVEVVKPKVKPKPKSEPYEPTAYSNIQF